MQVVVYLERLNPYEQTETGIYQRQNIAERVREDAAAKKLRQTEGIVLSDEQDFRPFYANYQQEMLALSALSNTPSDGLTD